MQSEWRVVWSGSGELLWVLGSQGGMHCYQRERYPEGDVLRSEAKVAEDGYIVIGG